MQWLRDSTESRKALAIFVLLLIPYVAIACWAWIPPAVLSVAEIHTEYVAFDVIDSRKAAFNVSGMKIATLGTDSNNCARGLFTPSMGATVEYGRVGKGPLEITVSPQKQGMAAGVLDPEGGLPSKSYTEPVVMETAPSCPVAADSAAMSRLPIWGRARIGREFVPATGTEAIEPSLLIDGKIDVSGHAVLLDTLFPVRNVILPVGSRLEIAPPASGQRGDEAIWWGAASVDPDKPALTLNIASEAQVLKIYRPYRTDPETVTVSVMNQLSDDPVLSRIAFMILALQTFAALAAFLAKHAHDRARQNKAAAAGQP